MTFKDHFKPLTSKTTRNPLSQQCKSHPIPQVKLQISQPCYQICLCTSSVKFGVDECLAVEKGHEMGIFSLSKFKFLVFTFHFEVIFDLDMFFLLVNSDVE